MVIGDFDMQKTHGVDDSLGSAVECMGLLCLPTDFCTCEFCTLSCVTGCPSWRRHFRFHFRAMHIAKMTAEAQNPDMTFSEREARR